MNKFLETQNFPKLNQEGKYEQCFTIIKWSQQSKNSQPTRVQVNMASQLNSVKHLAKKKIIPILLKLFPPKKIEEGKIQNLF